MGSTRKEHLLFPGKQSTRQMAFTSPALIVSALEIILLKSRGRKDGFLGMCSSNGDDLAGDTWGKKKKSMATLSAALHLYVALDSVDMCSPRIFFLKKTGNELKSN